MYDIDEGKDSIPHYGVESTQHKVGPESKEDAGDAQSGPEVEYAIGAIRGNVRQQEE